MTWYQQSRGFGDTHLGTVTRGRVHTECGVAFRAAAALSADPALDQVCPECCSDYHAWLMLLRVAGGVLGQHHDSWYCHDEHQRPVFAVDADLMRTLHGDGLLGFTEPDESGKTEISLTRPGERACPNSTGAYRRRSAMHNSVPVARGGAAGSPGISGSAPPQLRTLLFECLTAAVEQRVLLREVIALAGESPGLTDEQLRDRLTALAVRAASRSNPAPRSPTSPISDAPESAPGGRSAPHQKRGMVRWMGSPPDMGEPPIVGIIDSDDPWIAGYLKLRQAVLTGELDTLAEIAAYAAELRRGLSESTPPPSIVAFIAADIRITFPLLTDQLWTP